jgi:tryptophan synthase beta chain
LPALEPSHALARVGEIAKDVGKGGIIVMNLCGRGDKDIFTIAKALGADI